MDIPREPGHSKRPSLRTHIVSLPPHILWLELFTGSSRFKDEGTLEQQRMWTHVLKHLLGNSKKGGEDWERKKLRGDIMCSDLLSVDVS